MAKNTNLEMNTRFFINQFGLFYEGQVLNRYLYHGSNLYYNDEVILDKFIFHYKSGYPKLFCRIYLKDSLTKTRNYYTVSCKQLGILYKIRKS